MRPSRYSLAAILLLLSATSARAVETSIDFEAGAAPGDYPRIDCGKSDAAIVAGPTGHALHLSTRQAATACGLRLTGPIRLEKNLVLALDYKAQFQPGYEGAYLGVSADVNGKQFFWTSAPSATEWRHAVLPLAAGMAQAKNLKAELGMQLSGIRIYARVKEKTAVKAQTKAHIELWLDNLRLYTAKVASTGELPERESYANPPLMNWARGQGLTRLEYSRKPDFPAGATTSLDVAANFHTPLKPLEPGTWYWRAWRCGPLADAVVGAEQVTIVPEAHRFQTAAIPLAEITRRPRPRLLPLAKVDQPEVTPQRRAELVKLAAKIFKRGVPEHPGPHVPGDPRWPTWIDWYGKVAGGITGATGRRLQSLAQYAMLTGDAEVIAHAKQLALEACRWDPEGGSAMHRGDIGAHHLLRGLSWCYDVARDSMTPAERDTLRNIIVQRAEQFHQRLNPFRHGEANNHAWLQALGLGEAGLVLAGDYPDAAQWAEFSRQLFLGRFLSCLGYQGDNNEGIGYWSYGLGFIIDYADLMKAACAIDLYQHPWLRQTARFPMYCAPPGAWAVSFADTGMPNHGTRGPAETKPVGMLALRTADPYALWYSGAREPVAGLAPKAPTDLPQSIHYRHIGVVIFNTSLVDGAEGATVAMHSGRYWAGHQHPDQNHFVIHAYGEKLAIDGGYYDWYGSPHFKAYSMNTLAHNTLLVNGEGQAACTAHADGRVLDYLDSPGYGYTAGDASAPAIYAGKLRRFERRMLFIKPGFVVIHDLVDSASPARLDWLLHGVAPIQVDAPAQTFLIPAKEAALRGRFLVPAGLALAVKTGFPVEPVDRYSTRPVPHDKYFPEWTLYATPPKPAEQQEFLTAMQIQRLGNRAQPAASIDASPAQAAHGLRLHCDAATHWVVVRKPGASGAIRTAQLETDGHLAAIEIGPDNRPRRALAIHATYLAWAGKKLLTSPTPRPLTTDH
jgi:hypothetical protein